MAVKIMAYVFNIIERIKYLNFIKAFSLLIEKLYILICILNT